MNNIPYIAPGPALVHKARRAHQHAPGFTLKPAVMRTIWRTRALNEHLQRAHTQARDAEQMSADTPSIDVVPDLLDGVQELPPLRENLGGSEPWFESTLFHAAVILQWATLLRGAPTPLSALVESQRATQEGGNSRNSGHLQTGQDRYTSTGQKVTRAIDHVLNWQHIRERFHPWVNVVIESAMSAKMQALLHLYKAEELLPMNQLNELLEEGDGIIEVSPHQIRVGAGQEHVPFAHCVHLFSLLVRHRLMATNIANRVRDRERIFVARESGATLWLDSIFKEHEHVQAIVLDFGFDPALKNELSSALVSSVWKGFWNALRHQPVAQHLLGKQWTLHWRHDRGFVFRCLMILDTAARVDVCTTIQTQWLNRLMGTTDVVKDATPGPFKTLESVFGDVPPQRDRLEKAVRLQCWFGWLKDVNGCKPGQTYSRSQALKKTGARHTPTPTPAQALEAFLEMAVMNMNA